ncbi:hypothetical protein KP509_17G021000 [Ceratopteris richardii]|uniref:C2 domain-containing protein n=1 Tax=Ceratopteris richardii TaxID=49495 RepID=A0A8T2SWH1_CERRI|nr:hypothetical protein KP509_17G021000 [Ceratopteris richardii]
MPLFARCRISVDLTRNYRKELSTWRPGRCEIERSERSSSGQRRDCCKQREREMPSGTLEVFLVGASGLKKGDFFSKTDAYVVIHCGAQNQKSNVARNQGSTPSWNQRFLFYVEDGVEEMTLKVMDEDMITADDELGTVTSRL